MRLLSVAELAEKAGINRTTLYSVESGARQPTMETVRKLCVALGIENPMEIDEFAAIIARGKDPGMSEASRGGSAFPSTVT
jgi:DNA-binding XRE family transcriptional regulator